MNNKILGYGAIALAVILLFVFAFVPSENVKQQNQRSSLIPNIQSPGIQYNGVDLIDSTTFNESSNTCIGSRNGMQITVNPCVVQDIDGKEMQQYVDFKWNGGSSQNTGWIFVYDGGALAKGSIEVQQNVTEDVIQNVVQNQWINNYLVTGITSFVNLGSPTSQCEFGNQNNTQMYNVTRNVNGTFSQIYCFTTATQVNSSAYRLSGNADVQSQVTVPQTSLKWIDVSNQVQFLGTGLLNDSRAYYRVQNVNFNPGQTIKTRWTFTPQNISKVGKWHILGYNADSGLAPSLASNQYVYMDPWWDNSWSKCKNLNVTGANEALSNFPFYINLSFEGSMQANFYDIRIVNASCNSNGTELPYEFDYVVNNSYAGVWVKANLQPGINQFSVYYGNPSAVNGQNPSSVWSEYRAVYHFSEGTGTKVKDSASSIYNLTITGASWNSTGVFNNQLTFTATNQHAWGSTNLPSDLGGNNPRTIILWEKANGAGGSLAFYSAEAGCNDGYIPLRGTNYNVQGRCGGNDWDTGVTVDTNLNYQVIQHDGTSTNWFKNTLRLGTGFTHTYATGLSFTQVAERSSGADDYVGSMDEIRFANKTFSSAYINRTYSNTNFSMFVFGIEQVLSGVQIIMNAPTNNYVSQSSYINFSISSSAAGGTGLSNVTLYIWNASGSQVATNFTALSGNFSANSYIHVLSDGIYTWNALTQGNDSSSSWAINRTLYIDTLPPVLNITYPSNGSQLMTLSIPLNVSMNYTVQDSGTLSSCWFYNSTTNITLTCGQNSSAQLSNGYKTYGVFANDTANNIGMNLSTFLVNYVRPLLNFSSTVVEGENTTITFNLTADLISSVNATLYYNNVSYSMNLSSQNSTLAAFSRTLQAQNVSGNTNIPIYVNYTINGQSLVTSTINQTIIYLTPIVVSTSCNDKSMAFNAKDEQNLTNLAVDINYNFRFGLSNSSYKTVYGSLTNASNFYVCINSTVSNAYVLGYGEIDYQASSGGYVLRRYYTFEGKILSNSTENVALYDLANSAATSFLVEAKDSTLNPYVGKFLGLLRWYPQLNTYNLVEMAQTDENGRSIMRTKAEDVDYRVALWDVDGTLIKLNDPTRFACLTQPCTYSFTVFPTDQDYTSFTGIQQSLTFNETSNRFVYVWNDPSGRTQTMNITAYKETGTGSLQICNSIGSGSIGVINCDVSGYTGQIRAVVYRTASPAVPIAQDLQTLGQAISSVASSMGLFISAALAIVGFFIGIFNPIIGIIMQVAALIPSMYLGATTLSVLIGFAIMGVVVIHFMRRVLGG